MKRVVIIGSGFGGLVCASLLSHAGERVTVLERQVQPGGCLQSYRRGGLSFDTGFHYVGGLAEGQRMHCIFSRLGLMQLPWQRLDAEGFDRVTIGGETFCFVEGYEAFVDTLSARFPQQREALKQYVGMLQQSDAVSLGSADNFEHYGQNAYSWLSQLFSDPLLVNVLSGASLKMELRRESLPLFAFAHGNSSYIQSSWRLRGDGNRIVEVLLDNIRRNGGEVVCRAEVEQLIEHDGHIVAARCSNGETYEGDTFISDIHPATTFALVRESQVLKRIFRRRMALLENTFGMFTASMVLKPGSMDYFNHNKFVYRDQDVWSLGDRQDGVGGLMISARVPEQGSDLRQIDLLTPMSWSRCRQWEDTCVGHRGDDYRQLKQQMATECVSLAETVIPGLSEMVCELHTSTPLTYRDYTLTPEGAAYGARKDSRSMVVTMLSPRTPLSNLLLTGQSVMLPGLEGVAMTALITCGEILGKEYVERIIEQ